MVQGDTVTATSLPFPCQRGKVRDVYDLGGNLLIVSTDRISAFDWVLPSGIPGKGIVLTQMSRFWFERLNVPHHLLSTKVPEELGLEASERELFRGRSMLTKKASVIPYECVVRGYLEGSGWKEYQESNSVCGVRLPKGLQQCSPLPEPIFTPATKADEGHDENVSFDTLADDLGQELAVELRERSLAVYEQGRQIAQERGIIIADTKFEWGWCQDELLLIDEVLTPDSSRFWPADCFEAGHSQPSLDKQFVREWLLNSDWDRVSEPPALPEDVIQQTSQKYLAVYELLTGSPLSIA